MRGSIAESSRIALVSRTRIQGYAATRQRGNRESHDQECRVQADAAQEDWHEQSAQRDCTEHEREEDAEHSRDDVGMHEPLQSSDREHVDDDRPRTTDHLQYEGDPRRMHDRRGARLEGSTRPSRSTMIAPRRRAAAMRFMNPAIRIPPTPRAARRYPYPDAAGPQLISAHHDEEHRVSPVHEARQDAEAGQQRYRRR